MFRHRPIHVIALALDVAAGLVIFLAGRAVDAGHHPRHARVQFRRRTCRNRRLRVGRPATRDPRLSAGRRSSTSCTRPTTPRRGFRSRSSTAIWSPRPSSATSTRSSARRSASCCGATTGVCRPSAWPRTPRVGRRADAAMDRQLPGLSHGRDRRRRVPGRRHEDVRRALARRGAEAADERAVARRLPRGSKDAAVAADAHRILNSHHHDKIDSLTRARSTAFAASHVELYMRPHDGAMPRVERRRPGRREDAAALAHGGENADRPLVYRRQFSRPLSADGVVDGAGEGSAVRRAGSGRRAHASSEEFESVVRHLRPPRYPYEIDRRSRRAGVSSSTRRTSAVPRVTAITTGSGNVRLAGRAHRRRHRSGRASTSCPTGSSPRSTPVRSPRKARWPRAAATRPRRSTGVWANFPYLHNGSVPTLHHLLGPGLRAARGSSMSWRPGSSTATRVGQPLYLDPSDARLGEAELLRRFGDDRNWFNTARPGSANVGHDFWSRIQTDANRRALIEYLKTL